MNIDKNQILELLRGDGKHDQAAQVNNTMPDQIDTDNPQHKDLLAKLGLSLDDLKGKLGGLGNLL
jgi:hypothetical protein